jgi:hypothetical protein
LKVRAAGIVFLVFEFGLSVYFLGIDGKFSDGIKQVFGGDFIAVHPVALAALLFGLFVYVWCGGFCGGHLR